MLLAGDSTLTGVQSRDQLLVKDVEEKGWAEAALASTSAHGYLGAAGGVIPLDERGHVQIPASNAALSTTGVVWPRRSTSVNSRAKGMQSNAHSASRLQKWVVLPLSWQFYCVHFWKAVSLGSRIGLIGTTWGDECSQWFLRGRISPVLGNRW